jgi:hypothetical protein
LQKKFMVMILKSGCVKIVGKIEGTTYRERIRDGKEKSEEKK